MAAFRCVEGFFLLLPYCYCNMAGLQEGDRILEVNSLPTTQLSVDDVARILNRIDHGTVTLKLVPADLSARADNGAPHVYMRAQVG